MDRVRILLDTTYLLPLFRIKVELEDYERYFPIALLKFESTIVLYHLLKLSGLF